MTHKKTCGTCRFFDTTDAHPTCDEACHLNPPILVNNSRGQQVLMFTPTDQDSWCGQWEPSEEEMSAAIDGLLGAIFGTHEEASDESEQESPKPEDSWEKLREDARKLYQDYWGCGDSICAECPAVIDGNAPDDRYHTISCAMAQHLDIIARAEKLAGVNADE